ncbi:hypothetical protein LUD75_18365 [Epilithonimonas sp. JDS]|uniref:hypothetical protein n=1 Tax=Epilithonimonas sp. JDS TaxID=2902797 RepID=UPI001E57094A|nr:hypothetical protein [Epilithonimonas sp. JDS]MCD9856694.1 hypothetical protein [Epilithonimonas sp. JDS]
MQFIDFKKEHFSKSEETEDYFIEIPKEEIGFGDIEVQQKKDDGLYSKAEFNVEEDINKVTIKMKQPIDIRVNF